MGSVGNTTETIGEFINRAVGDNDRIRIEFNDAPAIVGTKAELLNNSNYNFSKSLYFGRFHMEGNTVVITAVTQQDTAKRLKRQR